VCVSLAARARVFEESVSLFSLLVQRCELLLFLTAERERILIHALFFTFSRTRAHQQKAKIRAQIGEGEREREREREREKGRERKERR